ncbi:MAG: helix-turn-helix domain-containing protein, partial [Kiritimatiellae bacterium]|nr:helix-turn-helix domain-containing protein [Kiritimatiellia bacterium]
VSHAVSSIRLDFEREGYMAAQLVGKTRLGREGADEAVSVPPLMTVRRDSTGGSGRRDPHVLQAVERIRREACNGLEAAAVIARAPGSKSLFNQRFREATGHSVHDEIERVRLDKAFALLSQTDTSVGAIAGLCGYRTHIALHKAFRLRTGMSMSEWRARFRT